MLSFDAYMCWIPFWHHSSSGTGRPVLELEHQRSQIGTMPIWGAKFRNWAPLLGTENLILHLSATLNAQCQFGKVGVPVPELYNQFQNWNGAEMGSNIYMINYNMIKIILEEMADRQAMLP